MVHLGLDEGAAPEDDEDTSLVERYRAWAREADARWTEFRSMVQLEGTVSIDVSQRI